MPRLVVANCTRPSGRLGGLAGVLLAWLLAQAPAPQAAEVPMPLHVWVSTSWAPPFLIMQTGKVAEGIIPDWYTALGQALGRPLKISYMPPRRLARDGGERMLDLRCFGSRAWMSPEAAAASGGFNRSSQHIR